MQTFDYKYSTQSNLPHEKNVVKGQLQALCIKREYFDDDAVGVEEGFDWASYLLEGEDVVPRYYMDSPVSGYLLSTSP